MKKIVMLIICFCALACDDIVGVDDISDQIVTVLAPANGVTLDITDLTFTWEGVENASEYQIQIATPSFQEATQILTDTIVTTTRLSRTLTPNTYEWSVRALNSDFVTNYTTQSFTIEE